MKQTNRRSESGFTLMELMITVVIMAVLAGIAYPAYQKYSAQSRRSDAYNALSQLANDLEKFYSECGVYTNNLTANSRSCTNPPGGSLGHGANGTTSANGYYQLAVYLPPGLAGMVVPPAGYLVQATAQNIQTADRACNVIRLDSSGARTALDSAGAASTQCWSR